MSDGTAHSLNKLNLPVEGIDDYPSVLWVMGSDEDDRDSLTFRDHAHTFFEIHIILAGSVVYGVGEREIYVDSGEFMLVAPRCLHRVISCSESFCKITVAFTLREGAELYERLLTCSPKPFKINGEIKENLDFLLKCAERGGEYSAKIARYRLSEIVYQSCEIMDAVGHSARADQYDPRVWRAKKYIDDNPQIFFGCEEVAAFCRISAKQLGRLFRKFEGVGLLEYIHRKKLEGAKLLLEDEKYSERQISAMLGFADAAYFSRFFLRLEGCLPSEYRKGL